MAALRKCGNGLRLPSNEWLILFVVSVQSLIQRAQALHANAKENCGTFQGWVWLPEKDLLDG